VLVFFMIIFLFFFLFSLPEPTNVERNSELGLRRSICTHMLTRECSQYIQYTSIAFLRPGTLVSDGLD